MDTALYLTFLAVSFGLIIVPGPNVLVIVSTSMTHGRKRGLQTVAGTSLAMTIQLLLVAIGANWFVQLISNGLFWLKWIGVAYLFYLGLSHIRTAFKKKTETEISSSSTFGRGFLVSISNPKTLWFFSAFLPQFVSSAGDYGYQLLLLSSSFLVLAIILDSCYALLSSELGWFIQRRYMNAFQNAFSGLLFLGASAWLAATNRST